jgi:hypothetical protein
VRNVEAYIAAWIAKEERRRASLADGRLGPPATRTPRADQRRPERRGDASDRHRPRDGAS